MKKTLQDLTIKDNFMFGAVMADENNCRGLLNLVTDIPIAHIEIRRERSLAYHPEYRGVRLDVYAQDEHNTKYNVEMQVIPKDSLSKRARYYRSQMDMDLLVSGDEYETLPDTYVIFICDFDPFGYGYYRYSFKNCCEENPELDMAEGCRCIFLNTHGKNPEEVSEALVHFLQYVKADLQESQGDFQDAFVNQLQDTIRRIKASRDMEERFMTLEELLKDERKAAEAKGKTEGKIESILILLGSRGCISPEIQRKIHSERDPEVLNRWLALAAASESVSQFEKEM